MGLKDRRDKAGMSRVIVTRDDRLLILIVCEGGKTEPYYFNSFPKSNAIVDIVPAAGNTLSVVDKAIEKKFDKDYDQVWCVFDKDSFPAHRFDNAINKAKANDIFCAYTNEAFELWFILHFHFQTSAMNRNQYAAIITNNIGVQYAKNYQNMRDLLGDKIYTAIDNAKKLRQQYAHHIPNKDNPYTTVDKLVEILLRNSPP